MQSNTLLHDIYLQYKLDIVDYVALQAKYHNNVISEEGK